MLVCGSMPALHRPLAGPGDVGGEVLVAPALELRLDDRVDLGQLAGQHEQLLGVAAHRLLEVLVDLLRRVDVRLMGREGAVLAVALAGPRERERVVAGEGDPAQAPGRWSRAVAVAVAVRGGGAAGAAARDEAPVLELDQVEDALLHPLRVHVLRVDAEPLGQRHAARLEAGADLLRAREGVLGADVVAVGGEAAEVGGAGVGELDPPVAQVGWDLDADIGHRVARVGDERLHVRERDGRRPLRQRYLPRLRPRPPRGRWRPPTSACARRHRRSRPARGRSSPGWGTKFCRITSWM